MAGNSDLVLAGVAGGGADGTGLAWFAPKGSTAPTSATATLDAAFLDAGIASEDGLAKKVKESSKEILGYGLFVPIRTIVTSSVITFVVTFRETNPVALAVYDRQPLSSITPDGSGDFGYGVGAYVQQRLAVVFDLADGTNRIRYYAPNVEVTDRGDEGGKQGESIAYQVTLTAYPGSDGNAVHKFFHVPALAA